MAHTEPLGAGAVLQYSLGLLRWLARQKGDCITVAFIREREGGRLDDSMEAEVRQGKRKERSSN